MITPTPPESLAWRAFHDILGLASLVPHGTDCRCAAIIPGCVCGGSLIIAIEIHSPMLEVICKRCGPQLRLRLHDDTVERAAVASDVARQVEELAHGR